MSLVDLLGIREVPKIKGTDESDWKRPSINPFDFVMAIQQTGEELIDSEWAEKQYNPYIVNRALSMGADTTFPANEMNTKSHIPKFAQFAFLNAFVRKQKRYNKWMKTEEVENLKLVQDYYNFSLSKARIALKLLREDQIEVIRSRMRKGGLEDE